MHGMQTLDLERKMHKDAEMGYFTCYYVITPKKADELREMGFTVTDLKQQSTPPGQFRIDWSQVGFEKFSGVDVFSLDEKDEKYTLAEKLWIISTKIHENPCRYFHS